MPGATRVGNMLPVDAVACCRPSLAVVSLPTVVANWWPQKHFKRCLRLSVHDGDYEAAAHGSAASADYPVCCAGSANNKRLCVCVCVFVRIRARARIFVFFCQCCRAVHQEDQDTASRLAPTTPSASCCTRSSRWREMLHCSSTPASLPKSFMAAMATATAMAMWTAATPAWMTF